MTRQLYAWRGGKFIEITPGAKQVNAPFVQSDELPNLKHPITGKIYTSRRQYIKDTHAMGYSIVGNDWVGQKHPERKVEITDAQFRDAVEAAEAIHRDPSKLRAQQQENLERLARHRELVRDE